MTYRIVIEARASRDIDEASGWIAQYSADAAERWFNMIESEILSLRKFPKRCPRAPEDGQFQHELRQPILGQRHGRYRVVFTIQASVVHVLHVRHGAREVMTKAEIENLFPPE